MSAKKEVTFNIKSVSKITGGLVILCVLTEENKEFYNSSEKVVDGIAPFRFTGQRAKILLDSSGCATVNQLKRMVSLGKTTITFDAYEGVKGESYRDIKGNTKEYTQDGWNLLSGTINFSAVAKATLAAFGEKVDMEIAIKQQANEFGDTVAYSAPVVVEEEVPSI